MCLFAYVVAVYFSVGETAFNSPISGCVGWESRIIYFAN